MAGGCAAFGIQPYARLDGVRCSARIGVPLARGSAAASVGRRSAVGSAGVVGVPLCRRLWFRRGFVECRNVMGPQVSVVCRSVVGFAATGYPLDVARWGFAAGYPSVVARCGFRCRLSVGILTLWVLSPVICRLSHVVGSVAGYPSVCSLPLRDARRFRSAASDRFGRGGTLLYVLFQWLPDRRSGDRSSGRGHMQAPVACG